MNSESRRFFLAALLGLTVNLMGVTAAVAQEPMRKMVAWECTRKVTCIVNGSSHTETLTETAPSASEACALANAAVEAWKQANCDADCVPGPFGCPPLVTLYRPKIIAGVMARAVDSPSGAWVVHYQCTTKSGVVLEFDGSGCSYCEALADAKSVVCENAGHFGGVCCCSWHVVSRPCVCNGRRRGR